MEKRKDNTLTGCHAASRQEVLFKNSNEDINVVAESDNADDGLALVERHKPNVVLMDLGLAGMNGIEATLKIREMNPEVMVIALTSHDREEEVIAALSAGAMAYCLKDIKRPDVFTL